MSVSNEFINELFSGTNFGETINNSVEAKRNQIRKTLRDQVAGYWSGHTAYHIVVNGGFLKDAKSGAPKELTEFGAEFMSEPPKEPCKNCDGCKNAVHLEDAWEES